MSSYKAILYRSSLEYQVIKDQCNKSVRRAHIFRLMSTRSMTNISCYNTQEHFSSVSRTFLCSSHGWCEAFLNMWQRAADASDMARPVLPPRNTEMMYDSGGGL